MPARKQASHTFTRAGAAGVASMAAPAAAPATGGLLPPRAVPPRTKPVAGRRCREDGVAGPLGTRIHERPTPVGVGAELPAVAGVPTGVDHLGGFAHCLVIVLAEVQVWMENRDVLVLNNEGCLGYCHAT